MRDAITQEGTGNLTNKQTKGERREEVREEKSELCARGGRGRGKRM